jgi:beta-lactamase class D
MNNIRVLIFGLCLSTTALANTHCFIAKENSALIRQEGECKKRHSPCSTFKLAISLMGYNEGILLDETHPEFPFQIGYIDKYESWRKPHNPTTWLKNSCIWFSQVITQKIGIRKFKDYLAKLNYGNQDASGDKGTNNGLTNCWLSSSLQISPVEQMEFLEKLVTNKLAVSQKAQDFTRTIMYIETLSNGWKLYGKTGGGYGVASTGLLDQNKEIGWFIGWIEKDLQKIIFVNYLEGINQSNSPMAIQAKMQARETVIALTKFRQT